MRSAELLDWQKSIGPVGESWKDDYHSYKDFLGYRWAAVPPLDEREKIVRDTHQSMGHPEQHKLLFDIGMVWWWPKMRDTVEKVLRSCPAC